MSHFDDHRAAFFLLAAGLAMTLACASSQESSSIPTQPPPQAQQPSQQASESESDASESAQGEAGESAPSESGGSESEQQADPTAAEEAENAGEPGETGDSADAAERAGTDAGESGSQQQRAGAESEAQGAEQAGADGDESGAQQRAGAESEGALGDPGEIESGGTGGIPIDEVPPELLEAFGRGASGTAGPTLDDEELRRALERLAEHQSQVDEMIQHEQTAAAASSGDIGTDSTGIGAAAPPLKGGEGGRRAETTGDENASSVSTASADGATDAGAGYRPPADVGSGSDDDTLAAQLRELAMNETDPVLRERYWEEYRKHKGIK